MLQSIREKSSGWIAFVILGLVIITMAFFGMTPFGSLLAGFVASRFSAEVAVRSGGAITVVAVLLFVRRLPALRQQMRPVYERLGILPPPLAAAVTGTEPEAAGE
mgnify:CR=1 FL=1